MKPLLLYHPPHTHTHHTDKPKAYNTAHLNLAAAMGVQQQKNSNALNSLGVHWVLLLRAAFENHYTNMTVLAPKPWLEMTEKDGQQDESGGAQWSVVAMCFGAALTGSMCVSAHH